MPLAAPQELRTYFATAGTSNRRRLFQVEDRAALFIDVLLHYRRQGRFKLHAFVVMPDHFHALLTPVPDVSLEKAVQFIKGGFSFRLRGKLDVWAKGFNESQIRTTEKFEACKTYIETNPVRAGLASSAPEFPFSSFSRPEMVDVRPVHLR